MKLEAPGALVKVVHSGALVPSHGRNGPPAAAAVTRMVPNPNAPLKLCRLEAPPETATPMAAAAAMAPVPLKMKAMGSWAGMTS